MYPGVVTKAGWGHGGAGNMVIVQAFNGWSNYYDHLSEFGVDSGDTVGYGSTLGMVGMTGAATGPHLHLELRTPNGTPVNAASCLP